MRKNLFLKSVGVVAIACVVAFNYNVNAESDRLPDVAWANVEALAQDESGMIAAKICRFPGSTEFGNFIPCHAGYPNVYPCDEHIEGFFSDNTHVCYLN
jgi:hypothetical protein